MKRRLSIAILLKHGVLALQLALVAYWFRAVVSGSVQRRRLGYCGGIHFPQNQGTGGSPRATHLDLPAAVCIVERYDGLEPRTGKCRPN